jgi:hypothetical protein
VGGWVGRHELLFGKQRVIGPLDWGNTRRTFQGAGAWLASPGGRLDAFWVRPVLVDSDDLDDGDERTDLAGVHWASACDPCLRWDAYAFWLRRDASDEDRFTVGGRVEGPIRGTRFDTEAEGGVQFGESGDESILAGMVSAELGWKPCARCWEPRIALGADWASGDGAGGSPGTWDQLFPTGHLWFGTADLVGRRNVVAARLTVTAKPWKALTLRADFHEFWRASEDDALYSAAGSVLRPAGGSRERYVGAELDLVAKWAIDRRWEAEAGWGHFFPGAFLEETGPSEPVDFFYASLTLTL